MQLWLATAAERDLGVAAFDPDGTLRFAARNVHPAPPGPEITTALEGRARRMRADGRLAVAVPLPTRVRGGPLVLRGTVSDAAVSASVRSSLLAVAATGVAVLSVVGGAALWTGRRLSGPFEELAGSARALGHGDFTARAPRSGLPEADQIADALDTTTDRLGRAAQRGAACTSDASHQLRTPLTALQLHFDALAAGGADPDAVAGAQAEADRLEGTIEELVALTRVEAAPDEVDVAELVAERVEAWRRRAEAEEGEPVGEHAATAPCASGPPRSARRCRSWSTTPWSTVADRSRFG